MLGAERWNEILDADLSLSSDESEDFYGNEVEDNGREHPASLPGWNAMSLDQRELALNEYRSSRRKAYSSSRRQILSNELSEESIDWTLKPRTMTTVISTPALSVGIEFPTRQQFQLRVAEVCHMLNKIPRWKALITDEKGKKACVSQNYLCARSWSNSDNFIAKATKTPGSLWKVSLVDISAGSRRLSTDGNTSRKCPFTTDQLVPIIINSIREKPSITAEQVRTYLKDYVRVEHMTDAIVQRTRERAQLIAYGSPESNIQFIHHAVNLAIQAGHKARLQTIDETEAVRLLTRMAHNEHRIQEKKKYPVKHV